MREYMGTKTCTYNGCCCELAMEGLICSRTRKKEGRERKKERELTRLDLDRARTTYSKFVRA